MSGPVASTVSEAPEEVAAIAATSANETFVLEEEIALAQSDLFLSSFIYAFADIRENCVLGLSKIPYSLLALEDDAMTTCQILNGAPHVHDPFAEGSTAGRLCLHVTTRAGFKTTEDIWRKRVSDSCRPAGAAGSSGRSATARITKSPMTRGLGVRRRTRTSSQERSEDGSRSARLEGPRFKQHRETARRQFPCRCMVIIRCTLEDLSLISDFTHVLSLCIVEDSRWRTCPSACTATYF